jgi:hypothetical protein
MFKEGQKIGMIWTLDRECGWNCQHCCVDAYSIRRNKQGFNITSNDFSLDVNSWQNTGQVYDAAHSALVEHGKALSLEQKLQVLKNIQNCNVEIGFSGGDIPLITENIEVIKKASEMFGRENVGLAVTGLGMRSPGFLDYLQYIGQLEFTFDSLDRIDVNHRQNGYNKSNLSGFRREIEVCRKFGVVTQALIPLSPSNFESSTIDKIYQELINSDVDQVYLMRTLPVGRAIKSKVSLLTANQYRSAIERFWHLQVKTNGPKVGIMCALKNLFPDQYGNKNPCTLLQTTLDITNMGKVILDAFGYNTNGGALDNEFIVGDLKDTKLKNILGGKAIKQLGSRVNENFGHCKIAAYLSNPEKGLDGLFAKSDPLYI